MRVPGRPLAVVAAVALAGSALSGCLVGGGPSTVTVRASFADVESLVPGAQVQLADVPVGRVSSITLDGARAEVTMAIDRSARVPADVEAEIDQTTVLGEYFVQLVPPAHPAPADLTTGATITRTAVQPQVEQLVGAGTEVFGSLSATQLAQIIAAGGEGFGGQAATLRQLLDNVSAVTAGYATRTADISTVIHSLDQLGSSLAPDAGSDAQSLTTLAQTTAVLAQQSGRFTSLLSSLNGLATQGRSLLETYDPQITDQLRALEAVAEELDSHQQDLAGLLAALPVHDATLNEVVRQDYIQVFENLIVCGLPAGGSSAQIAFSCHGAGGSP